MKKRSVLISIFILAFSVIFFFISSGAKAESQDDPKKDLVSVLHLESASLLGPKSNSQEGKGGESKPLRAFLIPLKEGLNAFLAFTSPPHQDGLTPKDTRTNYRAVIGFHFRLR